MREALLEAIAEEIQAGVVVVNKNKVVLYSNPFFEKTFSTDRNSEGIRLDEVIEASLLLETLDKVFSSEVYEAHEVTIEGRNNQVLEVRLVPFFQEGSKGVIGFFQDVTEEKRVEAIKRDFVANVSHELRTPLASIKGYAETLLDGGMKDKKTLKNFLTIIDRHANRMTALIEDILTLSMLESHQIPMRFELLDIEALLSSIVQGFEKQAKDKDVTLTIDTSGMDKELTRVIADRVRLEQVIVNLVDNAIKYTNKGGIRICAQLKDNAMVQVDVTDTGIGIPEDVIPRIFERFYRVDKGRSRELGGTGLGLAIVKYIIQGHNGRIWVRSKPGHGTTFSFMIPMKQP